MPYYLAPVRLHAHTIKVTMSPAMSDDLGKLILRVSLGSMLLLHGIGKLVHGIAPIERMVTANGLPALLAWGVYAGELLAPAMIILGVFARLGGLLAAISMCFAIMLAHRAEIFQLNSMWAWSLELQGLFLFGSLAIVFLGAGRYSVAGKSGRWN